MLCHLPNDVIHRILIRLSTSKLVLSITMAISITYEIVYRMQHNVEL
jgi:hypothetical protein